MLMHRRSRQPPQRAVITGATSGIGAAFARALPEASLLLTGRNQEALRQLAAELRSGSDREVVTVEERAGTTFVGLDIGWNVNCSYFIYRFLQEIVVCRAADAPRTEVVTVAGHINEAGDVFAEDYPMPPVREGDIVALLNAGGYHEAMSSTHCLRPVAEAIYLRR